MPLLDCLEAGKSTFTFQLGKKLQIPVYYLDIEKLRKKYAGLDFRVFTSTKEIKTMTEEPFRCFGGKPGQEIYAKYHDKEWGVPVHDDRHLFEMLILEGAQAGLSWETILKRRDAYRKAFHHFDPQKVAEMSDDDLECLIKDDRIIRNRLKIFSARQNARIFLKIKEEFGSFDKYLWQFVDGRPIIIKRSHMKEVPQTTKESDALSKDLKKRGMKFVGSTIMYAYMQAVGMVNDHLNKCPCSPFYKKSR